MHMHNQSETEIQDVNGATSTVYVATLHEISIKGEHVYP